MSSDKQIDQLVALANDLYTEGYACGIGRENGDLWFMAWAIAMQRVAAGEEYREGMVIDIFESLSP